MADFTAKDVQRLRQATGAGMMDSKRALEETSGDFEAAVKWLREKGLGSAAKRSDRENTQGAVAIAREGEAVGMVELKSETDFVAKSADFVNMANELPALVAAEGRRRRKRAEQSHRRPQGHAKGEHRPGTGGSVRAGLRQRDRYLPARAE